MTEEEDVIEYPRYSITEEVINGFQKNVMWLFWMYVFLQFYELVKIEMYCQLQKRGQKSRKGKKWKEVLVVKNTCVDYFRTHFLQENYDPSQDYWWWAPRDS